MFTVTPETSLDELLVHAEELPAAELASAMIGILENRETAFNTIETFNLHLLTLQLEPETTLADPLVKLSSTIMDVVNRRLGDQQTLEVMELIAANCIAFAHNSLGTPISIIYQE